MFHGMLGNYEEEYHYEPISKICQTYKKLINQEAEECYSLKHNVF